jgi:hypothetical protein
MKTCGGLKVHLHSVLNSALDEGEWSASRPVRFTSREITPVLTGWVKSPGGDTTRLELINVIKYVDLGK